VKRVEFEYERGGALAYLAAWDVGRARLFGRCEPTTGIEPFSCFVDQVMTAEPYASARRVFWVLDNGSSHRGVACVERLTSAYPNLVPVHLPIHAPWLNQVEIYFGILQRKVLTPADATSLEELAARILAFEREYEQHAAPFEWRFTRADLNRLLGRLAVQDALAPAAEYVTEYPGQSTKLRHPFARGHRGDGALLGPAASHGSGVLKADRGTARLRQDPPAPMVAAIIAWLVAGDGAAWVGSWLGPLFRATS
jgi:hypothetical protein